MYLSTAYTYYTIYITIILYYTMVTITGGKRDARLKAQEPEEIKEKVPIALPIAKIILPKVEEEELPPVEDLGEDEEED